MAIPFVVKAPRQGSTVGVYIIKSEDKVGPALEDAAAYDREFLVEKFVPGRELTVGVLGDQALPIIEIIPKGGFYDFTNKYPFLNPQAGAKCRARLSGEARRKTSRAKSRKLPWRAHRVPLA